MDLSHSAMSPEKCNVCQPQNMKSQKLVKEGIGGNPADEWKTSQNAGRRKLGWKSPHSSFTPLRPHGRWPTPLCCMLSEGLQKGDF